MKTIFKNFTAILSLAILIYLVSCSNDSVSEPITLDSSNDGEYLEIPLEISVEGLDTRSIQGQEWNHPILGQMFYRYPHGVSCRVYYDGQLVATSNEAHPTQGMITSAQSDLSNPNSPKYTFVMRFSKALDPSKYKFAFAGREINEAEGLSNDPFADNVDSNSYKINQTAVNNYNQFDTNYFGVFNLSDTNSWSSIKRNFTLKNIATYIYILSTEFFSDSPDNNYIAPGAIIGENHTGYSALGYESNASRSPFGMFNYWDNGTSIFFMPYVYNQAEYNFFDDKVNVNLRPLEQNSYNSGAPMISKSSILTSSSNYLQQQENNYRRKGLVYYPGKTFPYFIVGRASLVFPKNYNGSNIRIADSSTGLLASGDANANVGYIRLYVFKYSLFLSSSGNNYDIPFYTAAIPFPEGGFKQNYIYIIRNKDNSRITSYNYLDYSTVMRESIPRSTRSCHESNNEGNSLDSSFLDNDSFILEEYSMDEFLNMTTY